jgi:tRNA threonylcarbamoyladenosine biosynthesis protein TsaB
MILAINTSTLQFGVALLDEEGSVRVEYFMSRGEAHFGNLMPALDFLYSSSKSDIHSLKCLAIAVGPGSFTGLRVGLSVAKGLCHALEIPIVGISSLEALASQLFCSDLPITALLDSRKEEFFGAQFSRNDGCDLRRTHADFVLKADAQPALFELPSLFVGNSFSTQGPLIKKMFGDQARLAPALCWNLKASSVGVLGLKRFYDQAFDDPQTLSPIYLRPPDIRSSPIRS